MKKTRLAVFIPTLEGAGCERLVSEMLPDLNEYFKMHLILYHRLITYRIPENVIIYHLNSDTSAKHGVIYKIYRFIKRIYCLAVILRRERYDVVLSFIDNIVVFFACKLAGRKTRIILAERTVNTEFFKFNRYARGLQWIIKPLLRFVFFRADKVIVNSNAMQLYVRDVLGVTRATEVIYNGIDTEKFYPPTDKPEIPETLDADYMVAGVRLLNAGRLDDNKNQAFLIRIFPRILEAVPNARLFILGTGPNEETLRSLIFELGLEGKVHLLGWKNNVASYMRLADVFLLSSHHESFGNVLVESLACGTPVVATQSTEALFEILDNGLYGTIVPVGDAEGYIKAVLDTLNRQSKEAAFRRKISDYARVNFNLIDVKSKYIKAIREVTNDDN